MACFYNITNLQKNKHRCRFCQFPPHLKETSDKRLTIRACRAGIRLKGKKGAVAKDGSLFFCVLKK